MILSCCQIGDKSKDVPIVTDRNPVNRCKKETLYKIALVIGSMIGLVGALSLASLFMPHGGAMTPLFNSINNYTAIAANALNANPIYLTAFIFSIGTSTLFVSVTMLAISKCRKESSLQDDF